MDDGTGNADPLKLLDGNVIVKHPDDWYWSGPKKPGSSCFMAISWKGFYGTAYSDSTEAAYFMINVHDSVTVTDVLIHNYYSHASVKYNGSTYSNDAMSVYMIPPGTTFAGLTAEGVRAVVRGWRDDCGDCFRSIWYYDENLGTSGAVNIGTIQDGSILSCDDAACTGPASILIEAREGHFNSCGI